MGNSAYIFRENKSDTGEYMRETENNKMYKAAMQNEGIDKGTLQINVTSSVNSYPISEARISISYTGVPENTLEQLTTDCLLYTSPSPRDTR